MEILVNISNHPEIDGITRKARMVEFTFNQKYRKLDLLVSIEHYKSNGDKAVSLKDVEVILKARKGTKVDINGDVILPDNPDYNAALDEITYLENIQVEKGPVSNGIKNVIQQYISKYDQNGGFDLKIY